MLYVGIQSTRKIEVIRRGTDLGFNVRTSMTEAVEIVSIRDNLVNIKRAIRSENNRRTILPASKFRWDVSTELVELDSY